jgi:metalloendopeptidase OMA1, mitochondrial
LLLLLAAGCGHRHKPVPPGKVPQATQLDADDLKQGEAAKRVLTEQFRESKDPHAEQLVRRVLNRLLKAAGSRNEWRLTLLADDSIVNAAATRGNELFIWSGMLREARTESELAAVLGHEIAHILAGHLKLDPSEAGAVNGVMLGEESGEWVFAPYSHELEMEADHIGLFLTADAGFDPREVIGFWRRSAIKQGADGPAFFSSHPSSDERTKQLEKYLKAALKRYRRARPD